MLAIYVVGVVVGLCIAYLLGKGEAKKEAK